jgi:hypothetical protein
MDSSALEVRLISRACALLLALIVSLLLSTVRLPSAAAPGEGGDFSIEVVRQRAEETAMAMANAVAPTAAAAQPARPGTSETGIGIDIGLWTEGPTGELVFASAERYARCVAARARGLEDADCPSAVDRRRMVLDPDSA